MSKSTSKKPETLFTTSNEETGVTMSESPILSERQEAEVEKLEKEITERMAKIESYKAITALEQLNNILRKTYPLSTINDFLAVLDGKKEIVDRGSKPRTTNELTSSERKAREKVEHSSKQDILKVMTSKGIEMSKKEISEALGVAEKCINKGIDELKKDSKISMVGAKRSAKWKLA